MKFRETPRSVIQCTCAPSGAPTNRRFGSFANRLRYCGIVISASNAKKSDNTQHATRVYARGAARACAARLRPSTRALDLLVTAFNKSVTVGNCFACVPRYSGTRVLEYYYLSDVVWHILCMCRRSALHGPWQSTLTIVSRHWQCHPACTLGLARAKSIPVDTVTLTVCAIADLNAVRDS